MIHYFFSKIHSLDLRNEAGIKLTTSQSGNKCFTTRASIAAVSWPVGKRNDAHYPSQLNLSGDQEVRLLLSLQKVLVSDPGMGSRAPRGV